MGEQQDGGGDESRGIEEVFPWVQETGCIRFQRGAQLRDEVQAHCQQSQEQEPGHAQRPQEQAAFVGRVFKGAPSARQHAQDEEAQRLPEAAAEQEELPFARLALRQVPQGRLTPAAVGVQEFPRGARSRGARMEPAGGVGPPVRQPGMVQQVHKHDRLNQAQGAEGDEQGSPAFVEHDQGKAQNAEEGEDVPVIEQGMRQPQQEQERQAPHEAFPEVDSLLLPPVQLDEEAESEQEGEEQEGFADKEMFIGPVRRAVGRSLPSFRRGHGEIEVEVVVRVDDDDAQQGQSPEDIQNGDARGRGRRSGGSPGGHGVSRGGKRMGAVPPRASWPIGPLPEWGPVPRGDPPGCGRP